MLGESGGIPVHFPQYEISIFKYLPSPHQKAEDPVFCINCWSYKHYNDMKANFVNSVW